jgi:hypothetical protein
LWAGLGRLAGDLVGRRWPLAGGGALPWRGCWSIRDGRRRWSIASASRAPHAALLLPSKGVGIRAGAAPMSEWRRQPGERHGDGLPWVIRAASAGRPRLVVFDANTFKTFVASRLLQPPGERGALALFGSEADAHRLLCDHLTSGVSCQDGGPGPGA